MLGKSLSDSQREVLALAGLAVPVAGIVFAAAGQEGAFKRAGRAGLAGCLFGSFGLGLYRCSENERTSELLLDARDGIVFGGLGGAVLGCFASLVGDTVRTALN